MRFLVLIVCIVILVAVLSTQNSQPVTVSFLVWTFQASLAIVIFLSAISGVAIGILVSLFLRMSKKQKAAGKEPETIAGVPKR
ncbi:MAG: LapA family protein [Syntrophorhabdaceae bacterium]|nr:LapA family protein [Syntrophorhabdaceae bacterium]